MSRTLPPHPRPSAAYGGFVAFGLFWGAWGAALPALRAQAGVGQGELGTALLLVGAGALPAMLVTGRVLDRVGARLVPVLLVTLGAAGLLLATVARDLPSLAVGMVAVGAASGAADVAINTLSGQVEQRTARPVLTRAHGVFSLAVVVASLTAGVVLAHAPSEHAVTLTLGAAAAAVTIPAAVAWRGTTWTRADHHAGSSTPTARPGTGSHAAARTLTGTLAAVGAVGALAYAVENAHQSWGAVFLTDVFDASSPVASLAPATFAAAAAAARLTLAPLSRTHPVALMVGGGAVATLGSLAVATSPSTPVALAGLAVAATGTATLFPTLLSHHLRHVAPSGRGRATSGVATVAYLGYLLGPAYVGLLAEAAGLRGAVLGVAVLAAAFALAVVPLSAARGAPGDRGRIPARSGAEATCRPTAAEAGDAPGRRPWRP